MVVLASGDNQSCCFDSVRTAIWFGRFLFGCSPWRYFADIAKYGFFAILAVVVATSVSSIFLEELSIANFCLAMIACFVITNVVFFICTFKSTVFQAVKKRVFSLVKSPLERGDCS